LNSLNSPNTPSGSFSVLENLPNANASGAISDKRKKRAKESKKIVDRLTEMVASGSVSHYGENLPVPGHHDLAIKWQKYNADSIRECTLTRPPPTLRLHLDRTGYSPYGQLVKKSASVAFPMIFDMTPFISRGVWEERKDLSSLSPNLPPPKGSRVLYRLESAILHYGYTTHSGHFICIRRKPTRTKDGVRPVRVSKSCPDECRCEQCVYFGKVREIGKVPGKGWLQVSDDEIEEVGEEALIDARSAVFMLFYERVAEYPGDVVGEGRETSTDSRASSVAL
jgi:ubiquitin carboxyl-terminal hydrolase 1